MIDQAHGTARSGAAAVWPDTFLLTAAPDECRRAFAHLGFPLPASVARRLPEPP